MPTKKRIQVTIETERVIRIRGLSLPRLGRCQACGKQVRLVPSAIAARLAGVSERTLFCRLEKGKHHFLELPDGQVLICVNSLRED